MNGDDKKKAIFCVSLIFFLRFLVFFRFHRLSLILLFIIIPPLLLVLIFSFVPLFLSIFLFRLHILFLRRLQHFPLILISLFY
jgi:hypothetical protein